MTLVEQLFLGLVLAEFGIFGVTLMAVAWSTNRFLRRKAADDAARNAHRPHFRKAA
jgi:hypothetical protein